jgi:peptidoglycan hydrolase-like amidase
VGLCQVGAFGMAQTGATFAQILEHYYTGIRLSRPAVAGSPADADAASHLLARLVRPTHGG